MSAKALPEPIRSAARHAAAVEPALLNSERIRERFGSYGIEILAEADGLRRANLYSLAGNVKTCRTYALVLTRNAAREIAAEDDAISSGRSIGATFRESGWTVAKKTLFTGRAARGEIEGEVNRLMQLDASGHLALHAYELSVERNGRQVDYATILELHHPEYLDEDELEALFPMDANSTITPDVIDEMLRHFGVLP